MLSLYRLLVERLKTMILADVGLDIEAEFVAQGASRKADLLRLANGYEEEGLTEVAQELREAVQGIRPDQPLARSLRIAEELHTPLVEANSALPDAAPESSEIRQLTDSTETPNSEESHPTVSENAHPTQEQASQEKDPPATASEEKASETNRTTRKGRGRTKKK